MSRAATITDRESHLALRYLRERAGLTRRQVAELASNAVSADFLAKCEADPERVAARVARKPTPETLDVLLGALGSSRVEWQRVLVERPWVPGGPVGEGTEWDDDPDPSFAALHVRVSRALHLATADERARFAALAEEVLARRRDG